MKKQEIKKLTKDQIFKNIDKLKKNLFNFINFDFAFKIVWRYYC